MGLLDDVSRGDLLSWRERHLVALGVCTLVEEYLTVGMKELISVGYDYIAGSVSRDYLVASARRAQPELAMTDGSFELRAAVLSALDLPGCGVPELAPYEPQLSPAPNEFIEYTSIFAAMGAAGVRGREADSIVEMLDDEYDRHKRVVRDIADYPESAPILGNNYENVALGHAARDLAISIYRDRAFHRVEELTDCLAADGVKDERLAEHLRHPEILHVRGCWVIDWILGVAPR